MWLVAGCLARHTAPVTQEDLAGFEAPLLPGPVRAAVAGSVRGRPAEVELELASPLSRISAGCYDGMIDSPGSVDAPKWSGGFERLPEVNVTDARLGDRRLAERMMALSPRTDACVVQLGEDVLAPYVLEVDPARSTLALRAPGPLPPTWRDAAHLQLVRAPRTDWPLVPARLFRGELVRISPFILSTARATSELGPAAYALEGDPDAGAQLEVDALELAPELGVSRLSLPAAAQWKQPIAAGVLGGDVWGWFHVRIDPHGQRLEVKALPNSRDAGTRALPLTLPEDPEPEDPVTR